MVRLDLERYKMYLLGLLEKEEITKDTANTYFSCMKVLRDNCGQIDARTVKEFLVAHLNNKKQLSKFISAIRKYEQGILKQSEGILFGEPEAELYKIFKQRGNGPDYPGEDISYDTALRKINAIRDPKLKYTMRLHLKSGLRVSEVAKIRKKDLLFKDGEMIIQVREGKGRKERVVNVLHDEYLYGKLMEYVKGYEDEDLIFSDRDTIRHQYAEYGIKSHDLRRLNAKRRLRLEMEEKGKTKSAARKVVQMELGHASGSTTNIYLKERSDVGELTRG